MKRSTTWLVGLATCAASLGLACERAAQEPYKGPVAIDESELAGESSEIDEEVLKVFKALPAVVESADNPITDEKVTLGRMLYYETRLSANHDLSCNSCHALDNYGVDNEPTSPGHKGQRGERNSPSVYTAAGHFVQFWDGRAKDVEEQAKGPVLNPVEMAVPDEETVVKTLSSMPEYVDAFKKAFPDDADPVTFNNFAKAVGAFERKLMTPSRWDDFLNGDKTALTYEEKMGLLKYVEVGCTVCHVGEYLGGNLYQKAGLVKPWPNQKDQGRYEVTKKEADKMMFKVPGLRNIEKTAPYWHDGSEPSLANAVKVMGEYQLGKEISDEDAESIVVFLKSLTGELPTELIAKPELPESTDDTPKPSGGSDEDAEAAPAE